MRLDPVTAALAAALANVWLASGAVAQDDATTARARELFGQGVAHMDAGRYREAATAFRETLALRESAQVRFNLASALHQVGELGEAVEQYERVRDDRGAPRPLRREARRAVRELEPRLGFLTVHVEGDIAGVTLSVDDRTISADQVGRPLRLSEGRHVVRARRGEQSGSSPVQIAAGSATSVTLRLPVATPREAARASVAELPPDDPVLDDPPRAAPPAEDGGSVFTRWWFWTIVGVVVVGGILAGATVAGSSKPQPLQGTLDPPLLEVRP